MTKRETTTITIQIAAQRTGLSSRTVRRYVRRGLVNETLSEADLEDLCRVRRLTDLGINLAGVEAILRMRRRIEELQAQVRMIEARRQSGSPSPAMTEVWMVISPDDWGETD